MKVLVTGATGFLGQRLVAGLLSRGMVVRCLARPTSDLEPLRQAAGRIGAGRLEIWQGSLNYGDSYAGALEGCGTVWHLAAAKSGSTPVLFMNNVIATRQLVERSWRAGIERFVLVSSLAVYGTGHLSRGALLDEQCPLDPEPHRRDGYSYSKIAQEQVTWQAWQEGRLPVVVVRPGVIFGPGQDCLSHRVGFRLGHWLVRMGAGEQLPYTFVENCAEAVALAGTVAGIEGEAFNIVDDDLPTGRQLVKRYRSSMGPIRTLAIPRWAIAPLSWLCECHHSWSQGQFPAVLTRYKSAAQWKPLCYTNAKAKAVLGWRPRVSSSEGLEQTLSWWRQHGASRPRLLA